MTPIGLEILLHYYSHADDFRGGDFSAPAVRELIDTFCADHASSQSVWSGMLTTADPWGMGGPSYALTARGRVYIEHLLAQPMPVQRWVMPESAE